MDEDNGKRRTGCPPKTGTLVMTTADRYEYIVEIFSTIGEACLALNMTKSQINWIIHDSKQKQERPERVAHRSFRLYWVEEDDGNDCSM